MNLARRLAKLEKTEALTRESRIVLRFEGPGSEDLPQPMKEELESATDVITIEFVEAKEGCPAHLEHLI